MVAYTYSRVAALNFNTTPPTVGKSATGSVYAITDTTFTTPLNVTLVVGGSVTTTISSDANGFFPDFTVADRTSVVFKQNASSFTGVLTTTDPVPGPTGATGAAGAPGAQGPRGDLASWQASTFYPLNQVISSPTGVLMRVTTAHTSGASYDASKFAEAVADRLLDASLNATYGPTAAGMTAAFVQRANATLNAKADFGAIGDGVADDTAALQAFVTNLVTNGRTGFIPKGTYKITAQIDFPRRPGWVIRGDGRNSTVITQATDNVPIFNLGSDTASTMHSWGITGITFKYTNNQPSTNTSANSILFSQECNNGYITDCQFPNGYFGMKVASGIGCPWGTTFDQLWFGSNTNGMTGGAMDWSLGINGVPNNKFGRMLITCAGMVGPVFSLRGYNFVIDTLEFIAASLGPQLMSLSASSQATIGALKIENGTYGATQTLFDFQASCKVKIGQVSLSGNAMNITGASSKLSVTRIGSGGAGGWLSIDSIVLAPTSIEAGSSVFAVLAANSAPVEIGTTSFSGGAALVDQGSSTSGETLTVRSQLRGSLSGNLGDANYTVALGDPNKLAFQTAFTAARTIDLPAVNNNLFNGLYYDCIFNGAINGANTAAIKCNGTTLHTQSTDKAIVGFTYRRNPANPQGGWVMTKYETIP